MTTYEEERAIQSRKIAIVARYSVGTILAVGILTLVGCPSYNVYSQQMSGKAKLAEAQSSRQVAILEAHAKKESAIELADAEVIRAKGAAAANHILQNSLGGPEGYLRYLQIQAYGDTQAKLIYVPTEGGLPILESTRPLQSQGTSKK
jgi:predicted aminopeptidase